MFVYPAATAHVHVACEGKLLSTLQQESSTKIQALIPLKLALILDCCD